MTYLEFYYGKDCLEKNRKKYTCSICKNAEHCSTYRKYGGRALCPYFNHIWGKTDIGSAYKEVKMQKEFTKDMLENRMVVEYRDGCRRMVVDDMLIGGAGCGHLSDFRNNLTVKSAFHNMDIVKVYDKIDIFSDIDRSTLIWQRKEIKEVTLKEIAEKFGVDEVKVIDG